MSTPLRATSRRTHRGAFLVALGAVSAILAGCAAGDYDSRDYEPGAGSERDAGAESADGTAEPSTSDRSVVVTGDMYLTVEDPIAAADQAASIVQRAGGRIDARDETAPDERFGGSATLMLRIPSDRLDAVIDDLRELGTVDQLSTSSRDVTVEVTDLAARISTLRASTERIEGLLDDATTIANIITLENELSSRQAELEGLEARQRGLGDQVSMSTIELSLTTEPVLIASVAPQTFWDGLVAGWNALVTFVSFALIVFGVLLPWLAVIAIIIFAIVFAVRARKSRRASRYAAAPVPPSNP